MYLDKMKNYQQTLSTFVGPTEILIAGDTPQLKDYGKTDWKWTLFDPEAKQKRHETVFPQECQRAFAMVRRLGQYARGQIRHSWAPLGQISSVEESTVLILGLGDIGGSYARKMKALGARTIGLRRRNTDCPEWLDVQDTIDRLDEYLPQADIVAMVLPGGKATYHLMDENRIKLMKKGSYLLNAGRGTAIDPAALEKALRQGHLACAALDVTEPEPLPADSPLWDMDNLILTPHIAGGFYLPETVNRIIRIAADNLEAWLNNAPMRNVTRHK